MCQKIEGSNGHDCCNEVVQETCVKHGTKSMELFCGLQCVKRQKEAMAAAMKVVQDPVKKPWKIICMYA